MTITADMVLAYIHELFPELPTETCNGQSSLDTEVGLDSLRLLLLVVRCEDKFGVRIARGAVPRSVDDLAQALMDAQAIDAAPATCDGPSDDSACQ